MNDAITPTYRVITLEEQHRPKLRPSVCHSAEMVEYRNQRVAEVAARVTRERPGLFAARPGKCNAHWSAADVATLRAMIRQGFTAGEIARQVHRSWGSVCSKMDALGLKRESRAVRYIALVRAGLSNAEIAAALGVKRSTVPVMKSKLRAAGFKVPVRKAGQAYSRRRASA